MEDLAKTKPGALLVGSLPFPDTETAFRKCQDWLPNHLHSIPDGETGHRYNFVVFQREIWEHLPHVLTDFTKHDIMHMPRAEQDMRDEKLQEMLEREGSMDVMYDKYAIESYQDFKRLRDVDKILSSNLRFQVSLPTPTNTVGSLIMPEYRMQLEPFYTKSLAAALQNIQNTIPADDLTIQIDLAFDMALLEEVASPWWDLNETSRFEGVLARALILPQMVKPEVKLGFHLCYGDIEHEHWKQPKDLELVVKVAIELLKRCGRKVDYVHVPVPINRTDDAYFIALADLEKAKADLDQGTVLYLGLVHAHDPDGTKARLETARKHLQGPFGIATECGMGRTPYEDLESIFSITRSHATPTS